MEIEGKIIRDLPLQEGVSRAGNPWKKKEWVLETFGQYPKQVCFHFFGDRVDSNPLQIGQSYVISYDIESREYNNRWYTDIRAYASRPLEAGNATQMGNVAQESDNTFGNNSQGIVSGIDTNDPEELPF